MASISLPRVVPAHHEDVRKAGSGNALRAGVLGANDGLVSNLSLVMGVAGAALSSGSILITGFAGLLAGAGSMALGEWLSVQSARELYAHEIEKERQALRDTPDEELEEMARSYRERGVDAPLAREVATQLMRDPDRALREHVRDELAIDPEKLGGSAWQAAIVSFLLFAFGAVVPVLPFLLLEGTSAILASLALSGVALFALGGAVTRFTGRGFVRSGGRQLAFGLVAAALTFGVGRLLGVAIAG